MKYGIAIGAVLLGALIAWYVFLNKPVVDPSGERQEQTQVNDSQSSESAPPGNNSSSPTTTTEGATPGKIKMKEGGTASPGMASDEEGEDEEDYNEPVSKEDFKDFINTALDELAEDETTAIAIVKEMVKIHRAQPSHEDEIIRFYKDCSHNTKVSNKVSELCTPALREKGFSN
jgi:hypothetical protein